MNSKKNIYLISVVSLAVFLALILIFGLIERKSSEQEPGSPLDKVDKVENLLKNSSFENAFEPRGWHVSEIGTGVEHGFNEIVKHDKNFSYHLVSESADSVALYVEQIISNVQIDKKLSLLGFIRTEDCDSAGFEIEFYYRDSLLTRGYSPPAKGTTGWTEYNAWVKTFLPSGYEEKDLTASVKCVLYGKGDAWFDNVRLYSIPVTETIYDVDVYIKSLKND